MNVVKVVEGGADVAVLFNDWRMKAVGLDGKSVEMTGSALEVVRRQKNGTWRFVIDLPYEGDAPSNDASSREEHGKER